LRSLLLRGGGGLSSRVTIGLGERSKRNDTGRGRGGTLPPIKQVGHPRPPDDGKEKVPLQERRGSGGSVKIQERGNPQKTTPTNQLPDGVENGERKELGVVYTGRKKPTNIIEDRCCRGELWKVDG